MEDKTMVTTQKKSFLSCSITKTNKTFLNQASKIWFGEFSLSLKFNNQQLKAWEYVYMNFAKIRQMCDIERVCSAHRK
jgi:hypothetical protein